MMSLTSKDETIAKIRKDNAEKVRAEPAIASELFKGTDYEQEHRRQGAHST